MTFLELINTTRDECGVTGPALTTAQNLTGEAARIKNWVNAAWVDIQTAKEDWNFMRETLQFNTTAGKQFYTPEEAGIASFGNWKRDSFRASSSGADYRDEQLLNYMEWQTFRNLYQYSNMRHTQQRPVVVTIDPAKKLGFGAIPNNNYVIVGEYFKAPARFVENTDTPNIPERFHAMIVYRAMIYYAGYEAAPEVLARGQAEFNRLMNRLEIDQLPTMTSGPALA